MLIKIEAIVREEKFEQVKSALQDIQVNGVTISQVMGYGTQRGYTEIVRGSEVDILLHPKIKFEDVRSIAEKIELAKEYELYGVGYWNLMRPFRANWIMLE